MNIRTIKRRGIFIFIFIVLLLFFSANTNANTKFAISYTGADIFNITYLGLANLKGNYTGDYFKGNLDWTNNTNYPVECVSGSWISQLDDSVTCTAPGTTGPYVSWSGYNLVFSSSELNVTIDDRAVTTETDPEFDSKILANRCENVTFDKDVTANKFYGLFDWSVLGPFISWSGSILSFSSSELNNTLSHYLNTNRTDGDVYFGKNVGIGGDINITGGNLTQIDTLLFENDLTNHKIYDNSTCVIIEGDTSTIHIC